MVYRPAQVYNGSGWDDIGDKRIGAESGDIPQASVEDLTSDLASKVDYATPTNAQAGTAYTFVADDAERITTASNGSAVTFTIPPQSSVTWGDDTILRVVNYGAGALTVAGGSGVTVTNTVTTVAQYEAAAAIRTGSDAWTLVPFSGGADLEAAAVITSPSATGNYTDADGVSWDYFTFTSSTTFACGTSGEAEIVIVSGGGGGGGTSSSGAPGGGGAGGVLSTKAALSAGTYTVTIGGGGSGASIGNTGSNGVVSSITGFTTLGGGGGASGGTTNGNAGGSGGGGGGGNPAGSGGSGSVQGQDGGDGIFDATVANRGGGGGGGAVTAGGDAASAVSGDGGDGLDVSFMLGQSPATTYVGGGGGGGARGGTAGSGGDGGGGDGSVSTNGDAGTVNTGGGGGGGGIGSTGGNGGSGVIYLRVRV